jgi:hypothetical protein
MLVKYPESFVSSETAVGMSSENAAFSAGYVEKTNFVPVWRSTALPLLDDSKIVSRLRVVPEAVYVPRPTSHSLFVVSTIE